MSIPTISVRSRDRVARVSEDNMLTALILLAQLCCAPTGTSKFYSELGAYHGEDGVEWVAGLAFETAEGRDAAHGGCCVIAFISGKFQPWRLPSIY